MNSIRSKLIAVAAVLLLALALLLIVRVKGCGLSERWDQWREHRQEQRQERRDDRDIQKQTRPRPWRDRFHQRTTES